MTNKSRHSTRDNQIMTSICLCILTLMKCVMKEYHYNEMFIISFGVGSLCTVLLYDCSLGRDERDTYIKG